MSSSLTNQVYPLSSSTTASHLFKLKVNLLIWMFAPLFKFYYESSRNYGLEAYVLSNLSPKPIELEVLVKRVLKVKKDRRI